jgi:hypothetical protein
MAVYALVLIASNFLSLRDQLARKWRAARSSQQPSDELPIAAETRAAGILVETR